MKHLIAVMRVVSAAGIVFLAASVCSADFVAAFEAAEGYNGSPGGTLQTGQQGWYVPPVTSTDGNVYTYVGNSLGLSANPAGGEQFIGGRPAAGPVSVREQHDVDFSGAPMYKIQYDFNARFDTALGLGAANNIGSFSLLTPPATSPPASQAYISLRQWKPGAEGQLYQLVYVVYNAAGGETRQLVMDNVPLDHWYREETTVDFASHRVTGVTVTDLTTSAQTNLTPADWYLGGGSSGTTPMPGAIRFFGSGNEANIVGWDNLSIKGVPEPSTLWLLGAGLAGLLIAIRRRR